MVNHSGYHKQMAILVIAAKTKDLDFEDVLPEKMLEQCQHMTELKALREYAKELEGREKELQTTNKSLTKNLDEKQAVIEDIPEEFKALKADLQQAQRQIKLHKEMSEDSRERAERYQRQLKEIMDKQQVDASAADKIERLLTEVEEQQALIAKLIDDHRKSEETFAQLRGSDKKALEHKGKQLAKKDKQLVEKDEALAKIRKEVQERKRIDAELNDTCSVVSADTETLVGYLEEDTFVLQQENIKLLEQILELEKRNSDLEEEAAATEPQLDRTSRLLGQASASEQRKAQLSATAVSEVKPLNRYFKAVSHSRHFC